MIEVKFPLKRVMRILKQTGYGDEKDNDPSGKYLISGLRHMIGGQKSQKVNLH